MDIHKRIMTLTQIEFQSLTGEKCSKQNITFCEGIAQDVFTALKEQMQTRLINFGKIDFKNEVNSFA